MIFPLVLLFVAGNGTFHKFRISGMSRGIRIFIVSVLFGYGIFSPFLGSGWSNCSVCYIDHVLEISVLDIRCGVRAVGVNALFSLVDVKSRRDLSLCYINTRTGDSNDPGKDHRQRAGLHYFGASAPHTCRPVNVHILLCSVTDIS
jgi:hypothetical protein